MTCGIFITFIKGTFYNQSHLWHQSQFKTGNSDTRLICSYKRLGMHFLSSNSFKCYAFLKVEFLIMTFFSKNTQFHLILQGSILGSSFFITDINVLLLVINTLSEHTFAEHTSVIIFHLNVINLHCVYNINTQ